MSEPGKWTVKLTGRRPLSSEVFHLTLERVDNELVAFDPGQYVCLSTDFNGAAARGCYSVASAPRADGFDLCVRVTEAAGALGRFLAECELGRLFLSDPPAGNFLLRDPIRPSVFAVHGTGISPVRSMLQHVLADGEHAVRGPSLTLLQGARMSEDLLYRNEFEEFEQRHQRFRFRPVLSQAEATWSGRTGHIQQHLFEALGEKSDGVDVYLCGCREMVGEISESLLAHGFDEDAVIHEKYGEQETVRPHRVSN